jgi:hypothetical protein
MYITARGSDRKTQKLCKDIAQYCAEKLMGKRLSNNIELRIEFAKKLDKNSAIDGDACWEDDELRPREFTIRIREGMSLNRKLRTICHEMVHVKQYAKGEMKQMWKPARTTKFQGEYYSDDIDYWDTPWEIEAFGREDGLYTRWVDERKFTDHPVFDNRNNPDVIEDSEIEFLNLKK